jgi:UPF0271 protein
MVRDRTVVATDGTVLPVEADTICVHGDTPGAAQLTAIINAGLEAEGVRVVALGAA